MTDIVLIPAYMRPEYLTLCLEHLAAAEGSRENKEYWVCQDMRPDDEHRCKMQLLWTKEVLDNSPLPVRYIQRKPHGWGGNSYNTMEAYKEAYGTEARYVYLVEEDCVVSSDFFKWHESIQEKENPMCSIGYRCARNSQVRRDISDPTAYFLSSVDYASIGVAWRREELTPVIEHAVTEFYANPGPYLDNRFPGDVYSGWFHEQDGAIMRVMHERKDVTAWAYMPRTFHIGNIGYHRPNGRRGEGQLKSKIEFLRGWIHSAERIKEVAPDFGDIEPVPVETTASWLTEDLHCVERFDR